MSDDKSAFSTAQLSSDMISCRQFDCIDRIDKKFFDLECVAKLSPV